MTDLKYTEAEGSKLKECDKLYIQQVVIDRV